MTLNSIPCVLSGQVNGDGFFTFVHVLKLKKLYLFCEIQMNIKLVDVWTLDLEFAWCSF